MARPAGLDRSRAGRFPAPRAALLLPIVVAALAFCVTPAAGGLMAVDFGSEFVKVSLVRPGRAPVSIVLNEMSKRKSPAQVAFVDGDRLIGEEAAALGVRYPDRVFQRPRELLGRLANDTEVAASLKRRYLPYSLEADQDRGTIRVKADNGETYSAEELVASLLHYARGLAKEAGEGIDVVDCVITVPAYWGQPQRQALVDAAQLAGLNILGLVNNHAAAALQYGIDRDYSSPDQKKETVVLYDVGAGSVEAALVEYSSFSLKEAGGKLNHYGQFVVRDVTWAADVGGEDLEIALAGHLADEFKSKHGQDPRESPKAMSKLRKQVKRLKEMLSANTEAPLSVEEMLGGIDFRATVNRQQLEELAGEYWQRAAEPLRTLLERNNLKPSDIDAVELLGGGSRVPKLQTTLQEVLGGRVLDKHLDADEAVVMGAGLFAANLSTAFRLRKFGMTDGVIYPVSFQLTAGSSLDVDAKPRPLLPAGKKLPVKRMVHLPDSGESEPVAFDLRYDPSEGPAAGQLPPGVQSELLAQYEVTGISDAIQKYNETESFKVNAHFKADVSGLLSLDRVEAVVDYIMQVATKVPIKKDKDAAAKEGEAAEGAASLDSDDATDNASAAAKDDDDAAKDVGGEDAPDTDDAAKPKSVKDTLKDALNSMMDGKDAKDNDGKDAKNEKEGGKEKEPIKYETVMVPKKKTAKVALQVGGRGFVMPAMSKEHIKASRKVMTELHKRDQAKRETARAKNDLEAYIISTRDKLDADEEVHKVTTEEQRSTFSSELNDSEDWLYMDGEAEAAPAFRKRLAELRKSGDPIFERVREMGDRPAAVTTARTWLDLTRKVINAWESTKPWINTTDSEALLVKLTDFESWLDDKDKEQGAKAAHEDAVFTSTQVTAKLSELQRAYNRLNNKKRPKPPPAPKPAPEAKAGEEGEGAAKVAEDEGGEGAADKGGAEGSNDAEQHQEQQAGNKEGAQQQGSSGVDEAEEDLPGHDEL